MGLAFLSLQLRVHISHPSSRTTATQGGVPALWCTVLLFPKPAVAVVVTWSHVQCVVLLLAVQLHQLALELC